MGVRLALRSALSRAAPPDLTYDFDQERIVIGRGAGADVRLPHRTVSALHATVQLRGGQYVIIDHGSTNGTFVRGQRLVPERPKPLQSQDDITCGPFVLVFCAGVAATFTTSAERTASLARRLLHELIGLEAGVDAPPQLTLVSGPDAGKTYRLPVPPASIVIGRGDTCNWTLNDPDVAPAHLALVRDLDGAVARALEPVHEVTIGGRPVRERRLRHGDEFVLGSTRIRYEDPAEPALHALLGEPDEVTPSTTQPTEEAPSTGDLANTETSSYAEVSEEAGSTDPSSPDPLGYSPDEQLQHRRFRGADAAIYLLAALVLGLSVAGLIILLRAT